MCWHFDIALITSAFCRNMAAEKIDIDLELAASVIGENLGNINKPQKSGVNWVVFLLGLDGKVSLLEESKTGLKGLQTM